MVGLAHQSGETLLGDSVVAQLDLGSGQWRQVVRNDLCG